MFLDDRKRRILQAIIDDYIDTAEPIGSRTIARKHELGLSSATIRNEMSDLEEMGYLEQPHTSSGRIPSDKGYRLYVDQLIKVRELSAEEIDCIKKAMETHINEMTQLIRQASIAVSRITRYTAMAIAAQSKKSVLKAVQVVPIEPGKALVIVVTNAGIVRNGLVKVSGLIPPEFLIRISNMLNEKLRGCTVEQINLHLMLKEIETNIGAAGETWVMILDSVAECIRQIDSTEIYLDGTTNIFNYPEFSNVSKAKEFLNVLDEKDVLYKLLIEDKVRDGINIQIGNENKIDEIKDCSLISAKYRLGDSVIGSIGIIGPTRMKYAKVISSMNYIMRMLDREVSKLIGIDGDKIK